jgi:hypothetical protein
MASRASIRASSFDACRTPSAISQRMFLPVRVAARRRWPLARSASTAWAVALFIAACADHDPPTPARPDSSAGAPEPGSEAGSRDQGGRPEQSVVSDGGMAGAAGGAGLASDPEPEPAVDDPDDEPGLEDPNDDPKVDDPDDGEPPDDDDPAGLPCDVRALLSTRCLGCHSDPPVSGASISLLSYADLTAASPLDATATVAARSLRRMKDSLAPMPPAPASHATNAEVATLQAWVDAGTPRVECDGEPTNPSSDPYDAPPTCSSGNYWTAFDAGSPWMMPGAACITCHRQNFMRAPLFTVAGTVFPTAHEPDKCYGVPAASDAKVVITDANGQELAPLLVSTGGNFGAILAGLALPYRAKVVVGDAVRVMLTPQTNGDCNACHTQAGAQGARGRVIVP